MKLDDIQKQLTENLEKAAAYLTQRIQEQCPKVTGDLQQSIHYVMSDDGKTAFVGSDSEYAPSIEFGTSKAAAHPFLRTTLAAEADNLAKILAS